MRYLQMLNIVPSNQFRRDLKLAKNEGLNWNASPQLLILWQHRSSQKGAIP